MIILLYLTCSYILSGIGYLTYKYFLKDRFAHLQKKQLLIGLLALSLSLPLLVLKLPKELLKPASIVQVEMPLETHNQVELSTKLMSCYHKASNQEGFCYCESLQQANLVVYKSDTFYQSLYFLKKPFLITAFLLASIMLIMVLLRVAYLIYIVRSSSQEVRTLSGKKYTFLSPRKNLPIGSFYLLKKYIIWPDHLAGLTQLEQDAVLEHELAHLNQRDTFIELLLQLVQCAWLFNPFFYLIKKEMHLINEFIADQFAVKKMGNVKAYANLLLRLKTNQPVIAFQEFGGSNLKARITELLYPKAIKSERRIYSVMFSGLLILGANSGTGTIANEQHKCFEEFCLYHTEHLESGKDTFCKACLIKEYLDLGE